MKNNFLEGIEITNDQGRIFVVEKHFPLSYFYGGFRLGDALNIEPQYISILNGRSKDLTNSGDPCSFDIPAAKLLFIDTETTGLSGGAGTVAFLLGTGFFSDECFVIRQYFMRDYDEEAAMLMEFTALMSRFHGLVTFNGRSFDWNLISGRYTANRMKPACRDPLNVDLLFPARKLWKLKLDSCRLGSLEENILSEYRVDDIPGALIPSVYFKYLYDRDTRDIIKVVSHNEQDILSMVALLIKMSYLLKNSKTLEPGHELLGVGKILEATISEEGFTLSIDCFESCTGAESFSVRAAAVRKLTKVYKKQGEYGKAAIHWQNMIGGETSLNIDAYVEMAKYQEHKIKDPVKAFETTQAAIAAAYEWGVAEGAVLEDLKKRNLRLKRKTTKTCD